MTAGLLTALLWIIRNSPLHKAQITQAVCVATRYAATTASWQYLRIYSPGGTCSGMFAISDISNKLTFDLLTLTVVSESRVTWTTSVLILVFIGLSVLELGPMYATDRQTSDRRRTKASLNASTLRGRRHNDNVHGRQNSNRSSNMRAPSFPWVGVI